eukprot:1074496-Prorocentrum_lima.AAC.1
MAEAQSTGIASGINEVFRHAFERLLLKVRGRGQQAQAQAEEEQSAMREKARLPQNATTESQQGVMHSMNQGVKDFF